MKTSIMSVIEYLTLLLSELRLLVIRRPTRELTNEGMQKALTADANLQSLGLTLKPADVVRLACSNDLERFFKDVRQLVGTVDAAPMYPNFPNQVMEISEAEFRFHQMVNYFSTYGLEAVSGNEVLRGWLPPVEETEKVKKQQRELNAKVVELIDEEDMWKRPLKVILSKRERMTDKEKQICAAATMHISAESLSVCTAATMHIPAEFLSGLKIPFKENMMELFAIIFHSDAENKQELLHGLCQHTGDVLRCIDLVLCRCGYHFSTSQKRLLVRLLESYPVKDFKANLILSGKKAKRSLLVLQYLDYNQYSRSPEHKAAVASLRNGDLRSWEAQAKYLVSTGDDGALDFISQRPGMMLRWVVWLLRVGYHEEAITEVLCRNASSLSLQTLTTLLTKFGRELPDDEEDSVTEDCDNYDYDDDIDGWG